MAYKVLACLALLVVSSAKDQSRWSRQISSYTADISDWVPLSGPVESEPPIQLKRQAVAEPRVLSEPYSPLSRSMAFNEDAFPSRAFYNSPPNRQLYLQSVPSAPQNYLSDQGFGQGIKFGLSQPNFPLTQGFISPQYNFDNVPQFKPKPQSNSIPIKFENFPQNIPQLPAPTKPFQNQLPKQRLEAPKFVDGYRVENNTDFGANKQKPQSLQKIRFDNYDKSKEVTNTPRTKVEREEVQLLYVPLESLNRGQFNFRNTVSSPQILNSELYSQSPKRNPLMQNLAAEIQRSTTKPVETYKPQNLPNNFNSQFREVDTTMYSTLTLPFTTTTTPTTPKPKKLKPHQPPLAIFLTQDVKKDGELKVSDVLSSLKNARTVPVLDSVNPLNAPEVFIGPSSLNPPDGFVKFELPYLSNIENKDKKLKQLPFFVAPLSYNTPQGFAKIPFPSPHVGSVVINSQIQESSSTTKASTVASVFPNSYTEPFVYNERQPVTQKPKISYYSTAAPKENVVYNYNQNYYSFEPQTVSTIRPKQEEANLPIPKPGSYFINNENQYNPSQYVHFPQEPSYQNPEPNGAYNNYRQDTTSTTKTSTTLTTRPPSTYSTRLLETHNPYSINQGLQFSAPNEYQNFFDEYKEQYVTKGYNPTPISQSQTPSQTPVTVPSTEKVKYVQTQSSTPAYQQNYPGDTYYNQQQNQELNERINQANTNEYSSAAVSSYHNDKTQPSNSVGVSYNNGYENIDSKLQFENNSVNSTQSPVSEAYLHNTKNVPEYPSSVPEYPSSGIESSKSDESQDDNTSYNSRETDSTTSTTSTSTTTTRRTPVRTRGRPRYPTSKPESNDYSTRSTVTRRPLRERRPSSIKSRYEPNKIVTERTTKQSFDSSESTTRNYRHRTRGKIHYKSSEGDEIYEKSTKEGNKMADLAYQRDILHQNYPVTLMERASTVDIEAITEPTAKSSSSQDVETPRAEDTANAYSNDQLSITENMNAQNIDTSQYVSTEDSNSGDANLSKNHNNGNDYQFKYSRAPQGELSSEELKEETYFLQTTPKINQDQGSTQGLYETNQSERDSESIEYSKESQEQATVQPEIKGPKDNTQHEISQEELQDENIVETTPSYNRVRIRPGVIRQQHQTSTTESSRTKNDRKNIVAITYRPAFDKRRTTMRIEEIEADLKTKQIHTRAEFNDYRQPVYKPDPTTESTSSTTESTTKRGQFRRRRPSYTTTSTEGSINRRPYEAKNRFRGRRPTEKPTDKPDVQDEMSTTAKYITSSKYSQRPRLSERFNKKPESQETPQDQDPHSSIHRPKYASPDSDRWSPNLAGGSFKPFNPNDISDQTKEGDQGNAKDDELDIITVGPENILISVTPATNNRVNKKVPDIPPTLEALVEQTKVTIKSEPSDTMSTFESMLEEVMKSLEEQDEDEYTNKVMKHKGGEIGEIPPDRIISSGVNYSVKSTTPLQEEITTTHPDNASSPNEEEPNRNRRRGYWKKVKVRPVVEGIEAAESQYYSKTINRLGQDVPVNSIDKTVEDKTKFTVTTYKPKYSFIKNFFNDDDDDETLDVIPDIDIPKINSSNEDETLDTFKETDTLTTESYLFKETPTDKVNPGEMDLGTGSPDPTYDDTSYYSEPTEPTSTSTKHDRSDTFSFMDYLFGVTSSDESSESALKETQVSGEDYNISSETEASVNKTTTESTYIPEEYTSQTHSHEVTTEPIADKKAQKVETSSVSSFMDPRNVISTSMSTEISHETEICYRGKCIKTVKDLL